MSIAAEPCKAFARINPLAKVAPITAQATQTRPPKHANEALNEARNKALTNTQLNFIASLNCSADQNSHNKKSEP